MVQQSVKPKNVLFLTYDGLTDMLGQSQILPYLEGLSKYEFNITIISFEKKKYFSLFSDEIQKRCNQHNIKWIHLKYHKRPLVLSTLYDIIKLFFTVYEIHRKQKIDIIHCRSYITSLVGLWFKKKKNIGFIFDMRGFWADERFERNIWNPNNIFLKKAYNYFKKKEIQFINHSDRIISLTQAAKDYIIKNFNVKENKIEIIPCATKFNNDNQEVNISSNNIKKVVYIGSLRTSYLVDEMFLFFSIFKKKYNNAKFNIFTPENKEFLLNFLSKYNLEETDLHISFIEQKEVNKILLNSDLGICFIKNSFSAIASSPTKFSEMLAANIPVVCNNVGDLKEHCKKIPYTYCFDELNEETFKKFIDNFEFPSDEERKKISQSAQKIYDLDLAVNKYLNVYRSLYE